MGQRPMSIPSQLPDMTLATRPGGLQALALRPLQTITAVVLGQGSDGVTQVQVGRQTLGLTLPAPVPPGTTLTLQAQGSGAEQRLVLLQQAPPADAACHSAADPAGRIRRAARRIGRDDPARHPADPGAAARANAVRHGSGSRSGRRHPDPHRRRIQMVLPTPMPPGTVLTLQAHGSGTEQRLVLMQQSLPGTPRWRRLPRPPAPCRRSFNMRPSPRPP